MERLLTARHAAIEGGASISLLLVVTDLRVFGCATELEYPFYRLSPTNPFHRSARCDETPQIRGSAARLIRKDLTACTSQ